MPSARRAVGKLEPPPPPQTNIFRDFLPIRNTLQILLRNNIEKTGKIKDLGLLHPSKILPKTFQNQCPEKHAIFHRFLFEKCFVAQAPTSISHWFLQCFLLVEHFSSFRCSHAFWIRKTYQKHFQNEGRTLEKSMSKTCCFSTLIFSGFGLKLEGLGAPRWRQVGSKFHLRVYSVALFDVLKWKIVLKWCLGGLRVRFWLVFGGFWNPFLRLFGSLTCYILPPLN